MYADDSDGQLMDMCRFNGVDMHHGWTNRMYPYAKTFKIYLCPSAIYFWSDLEFFGSPYAAWDYRYLSENVPEIWSEFIDQQYNMVGRQFAYGSYGKNVYVSSADMIEKGDWDYSYWYRNIRVRGTSQIGLFGDCNYTGAFPNVYDSPASPASERIHGPVDGENINRWNLDRHKLSVNFLFLDWGVRKVGLKQLWQIKWSKQTVNVDGRDVIGWGQPDYVPDPEDPEEWPEWMQGSKNYDL
ncbi:MAG: hypothetical protein ACYSUK_04525 [Planctomycetota bacterium]|jgi:hypothetical protein